MSRLFFTVLFGLLQVSWTNSAVAAASRCERPKLKAPVPVRTPEPGEMTVATQNLWRLFDDVDDGGQVLTSDQYQLKLGKLARQIVDVLQLPDVVAVQEVESREVLASLAAKVASQTGKPAYQPIVVEGQDPGGIDVGFLVRPDWKIVAVTPLLATLRMEGKPLFDRPPLHLVVQDGKGARLELVNVHLKSLYGSAHPGKVERIAWKRTQQATALAGWWRQYHALHPNAGVLVLGDFNATPEVLAGVDVLGELRSAGLVMLGERLPEAQRYSYVFQCHPELIDNILASPGLLPQVAGMSASRGNADAQRSVIKEVRTAAGSSDHDALVLYLRTH